MSAAFDPRAFDARAFQAPYDEADPTAWPLTVTVAALGPSGTVEALAPSASVVSVGPSASVEG